VIVAADPDHLRPITQVGMEADSGTNASGWQRRGVASGRWTLAGAEPQETSGEFQRDGGRTGRAHTIDRGACRRRANKATSSDTVVTQPPWLIQLRCPARLAYEAGSTGFGLASPAGW